MCLNLPACEEKKKIVKRKKRKKKKSSEHPSGKPHWLSCCDVRIPPAPACVVSVVNMAAVDVIVDNLVTLWRIPAVKQNLHWIFLLISVVGSVLKELELIPQTYFSSSKNVLNV